MARRETTEPREALVRRHLSYANVVATLAMILAMSGTAIAGGHYLVTSTSQIKPSVLKKLRGTRGDKGERGTHGEKGERGEKGEQGLRERKAGAA